jgi:hypothetical protein
LLGLKRNLIEGFEVKHVEWTRSSRGKAESSFGDRQASCLGNERNMLSVEHSVVSVSRNSVFVQVATQSPKGHSVVWISFAPYVHFH